MSIYQIKHILQTLISEERYQHSLRVAVLSKDLALHYYEDSEKIFLAALIHDCAKELTPLSSDITYTKADMQLYKQFPKIWHAFVVEKVAAYYFPMIEASIVSNAKWHTTGKRNMSLLEKIIFVADYVESGRTFDLRETLLGMAFKDIDSAVAHITEQTLTYLLSQSVIIHPELLNCYNYYIPLKKLEL